jgi:predicted nicotinamide N-methyase
MRRGREVARRRGTSGAAQRHRGRPDPLTFVRDQTRLAAVPTIPEIRIHHAHEATGLWRLGQPGADGADPPPPYWAFPWAGGLALARHILDWPAVVAGRSVLDLGAGSGLVAIAAALAGASAVSAAETDPYGLAAIALNAAANGVSVSMIGRDLTSGPAPPVDLLTVGDLFYERPLAERVEAFLDRCVAAGVEVLVGDPGRTYLPRPRLRLIAEYRVPDVGDVEGTVARPGAVYAFETAKLLPEAAG